MIVVGYNGFTHSSELFARLYGRAGVDQYRVLGHDAGAAIFVDGQLIAAVEEERLCRVKKTSCFPARAIEFCLRTAGVSLNKVDQFAFGWSFSNEVMERSMLDIVRSKAALTDKFVGLAKLAELYDSLLSADAIRRDFHRNTGLELRPEQLVLVPHHWAHLMCGYYLSGCADSAFLISDGRAEQFSSVMGEIRRDDFEVFDESSISIRDSIGLLYSKVTRYLGFVPNNDEYKVMGLSAFGEPPDRNVLLDRVVELREHGTYRLAIENPLLDTQAYYPLLDEIFARDRATDDWDFKRRVARLIQDCVEHVTAHQVRYLEQRTRSRRLLLEGGVALNCVNNTALLEHSRFDDLFVSFGASDCGIPIGAGFFPAYLSKTFPETLPTSYLGPECGTLEIEEALAAVRERVRWTELSAADLIARVAELLRGKVVIGWLQGHAEFGPRALGARSILANPSFPDIQDIINIRVKKRETFRPFAPVVLESLAGRVFDLGKKRHSPFMTFVFPTRSEYRERIRGACHVDGTARIQTVSEKQNPLLSKLLQAFYDRTGVPCLINTSFNVASEPMVCSPADAIRCFLDTDIDYLVLQNTFVTKVSRDAKHD